ncbi:MAG: YggS family pyridoxal phosphate-dependent enzyme [Acidobacteriota bacterium]|nr:MAG: YggS family pyridoxal phosphate-dependent enzyme [Acidobacteriota bacterium]
MELSRRIEEVRERIGRACDRARRRAEDVELVAVSKTFPPETVRAAHAAGLRVFGENRVEEALPKMEALREISVAWHMVGQVQTRKARDLVGRFALVHSLDREKLAKELQKRAEAAGVEHVPVLAQVDFSDRAERAGVAPENLLAFLEALASCPRVAVEGLMTLPPYDPDPEKTRPFFVRLRELAERARERNFPHVSMRHLSMGMTEDFQIAIEEGATLVRVGRAIFGERQG